MKKLKELILHIAETCKDDPEFGATKLNKILFFADFLAYGINQKSITGEKYYHLPNGPTPKKLKRAQEELKSSGRAKIEERPYFGRTQKRLIPLQGPDTSMFDQEELDIVDMSIKLLQGLNASQVSDATHRLLPWLLTESDEEIPYHATFSMFLVPVRQEGITWAHEELERLRANGYSI